MWVIKYKHAASCHGPWPFQPCKHPQNRNRAERLMLTIQATVSNLEALASNLIRVAMAGSKHSRNMSAPGVGTSVLPVVLSKRDSPRVTRDRKPVRDQGGQCDRVPGVPGKASAVVCFGVFPTAGSLDASLPGKPPQKTSLHSEVQ